MAHIFSLIVLFMFCGMIHSSQDEALSRKFGLKLIYVGEDAVVDIVALHGLDGGWEKTWTNNEGVFWLRDLLPEKLPHSRIYSFGYDSRTHGRSPLTHEYIYDFACTLTSELVSERRMTQTERRPIIFVAHSLGGLVAKSALIHSEAARADRREHDKAIILSTYGILFLGTPHQGGEGADIGQVLARIGSLVTYTSQNVLQHLRFNSEWLQQQQGQYSDIANRFDTKFFYEMYPMRIPIYGNVLVVPKHSAIIRGLEKSEVIPLEADHKSMVKFSSEDDEKFIKVSSRLTLMSIQAADKVAQNWNAWDKIKIVELGKAPNSGNDVEPTISKALPLSEIFNVPSQRIMLQNPKFTGRSFLLDNIRSELTATTKGEQTKVVVLFGPGGVGKTQVANEFSYRFKETFSTIFWIDGSSKKTVEASIGAIMRRIDAYYSTLGLESSEARRIRAAIWLDRPLDSFLNWLSLSGNSHWLLIFDNVDDVENLNIRTFFPRTTHGHILVTSRRSHFDLIYKTIDIEVMQEDEALSLLEISANMNVSSCDPRQHEAARALVSKLGYLPLAIAQAGAYMAIHKFHCDVLKYASILKANTKTLLASRPAATFWDYRNETVMSTWETSLAAIHKENPLALDIISLCSLIDRVLPTQEILYFAFGLNTRRELIQNSINLLISYSLAKAYIQNDDEGNLHEPGLIFHPLIHWWARSRLDSKTQVTYARQAAIMILAWWKVHDSEVKGSLQQSTNNKGIDVFDAFHIGLDVHLVQLAIHMVELFPDQGYSRIIRPTVEQTRMCQNQLYGLSIWLQYRLECAVRYTMQWLWNDPYAGHDLWSVFAQIGKLMRAEWLYRLSLTGIWRSKSHAHPWSLAIAENVAREDSDRERAHDWYEWLFACRSAVLGRADPTTLQARLGLKVAQAQLGKCSNVFDDLLDTVSALEISLGPNNKTITKPLSQIRDAVLKCDRPETNAHKSGHQYWSDFAAEYLDANSQVARFSALQLARMNIRLGRWWKAEELVHSQHSCGDLTEISTSSLETKLNHARVALDGGSFDEIEIFINSILSSDVYWPCLRWDLLEEMVLFVDELCGGLYEDHRSSIVRYYRGLSQILRLVFTDFSAYLPLHRYQSLLEDVAIEEFGDDSSSNSVFDALLDSMVSTPSAEAEAKWRMGNMEAFKNTAVNSLVWDALYWYYITAKPGLLYSSDQMRPDLWRELWLALLPKYGDAREEIDYLLSHPGPSQLLWLSESLQVHTLLIFTYSFRGWLFGKQFDLKLKIFEAFYDRRGVPGLTPHINIPAIRAFFHFSAGCAAKGELLLIAAQLWEEQFNFSCTSQALLAELTLSYYLGHHTATSEEYSAFDESDDRKSYHCRDDDDDDDDPRLAWLSLWFRDPQLGDLLFRKVEPSCEPYTASLWRIYAALLDDHHFEKAHYFLMRLEDTYFGIRDTCRRYLVLEGHACQAWTPRWEYVRPSPVYDPAVFPHLSQRAS